MQKAQSVVSRKTDQLDARDYVVGVGVHRILKGDRIWECKPLSRIFCTYRHHPIQEVELQYLPFEERRPYLHLDPVKMDRYRPSLLDRP